eukprot:TRINITY_DN13232_c0_g2_i1.p1 TRINITY_DN13232_c0_g2~~TRINITY_DN13232_c0_g2_i1.p1  ORF type:complete len:244 (-),score=28.45 TRINITY_DN13232_c0_g2_i1:513-1244(-)
MCIRDRPSPSPMAVSEEDRLERALTRLEVRARPSARARVTRLEVRASARVTRLEVWARLSARARVTRLGVRARPSARARVTRLEVALDRGRNATAATAEAEQCAQNFHSAKIRLEEAMAEQHHWEQALAAAQTWWQTALVKANAASQHIRALQRTQGTPSSAEKLAADVAEQAMQHAAEARTAIQQAEQSRTQASTEADALMELVELLRRKLESLQVSYTGPLTPVHDTHPPGGPTQMPFRDH